MTCDRTKTSSGQQFSDWYQYKILNQKIPLSERILNFEGTSPLKGDSMQLNAAKKDKT